MRLTGVFILSCLSLAAEADTVTVAVASNFRTTAELVAAAFRAETGHEVRISVASTGKLHAQVVHGAPFDVLLAADTESPRLLEEAGLGVVGSRFTYAIGILVLWSAADGAEDCRNDLQTPGNFRLAIANPATAPYGRAAEEFLQAAGLWESLAPRLVYGENVGQTMHFAASGNARYALVAKSQAIDPALPLTTCLWQVPGDAHAPLDQQAVLLQRAADNEAARSFLHFLQSATARDTIRRSGYGVP
ncbi:MAG: molybdate ABC transporter substrate-binding protein [Proteobacteria bacterium]|nr:molybdate ABC transporter substrate-binding protein [Pseudomonadota bacterium]MDA1062739.1 molybdate ABC transporter substrate-binding protein [Pseudomonadota bacterium]